MESELESGGDAAGLSNEDVARLMAGGPSASTAKLERGRVRGTIIEVRGADVYVDIGGKSEAFLPLVEFEEAHAPAAGAVLEFMLQGLDRESGLMRLSLREAMAEADWDALRIGDVIEGRVTGVNIGGLELQSKNFKAFLPKSQVELERVEDFTPYIGRRIDCEVTEIDRRGKRLVVSRRKLLERQREEKRKELKYTLAEGQVRQGVVRRLTDFGAFVDLGGIEGLLHVSDISYARVKHPRDVLKEGQEIEVRILKIDLVKDRISLGAKQLAPDPWNLVEGNYRAGQQVDGRVVKLMDFGAFVELEPGIEGLIPISEISWTQRIRHPKDVLKEGDSVRVVVLNVDAEKHKLSLSLKALGEDPWVTAAERYPADTVCSGRVTQLTEFGAFVQLEEGIEGLVHVSEMSDKHVRRPSDVAKPDEVVQVRVKSVDSEQRRISLSMKLAAPSDVAAEGGAPAAGAAPPPPKKRKKALKGGLD